MTLNQFFTKIENRLNRPRFRPLHSFWLNYRLCGLKMAFKMPIYLYGKQTFSQLGGSCEFTCSRIYSGMIKFGVHEGRFYSRRGSNFFLISDRSKLIFDGPARFGIDTSFRLTEGGTLHIGEYVRIGDGVKILCEESITIGRHSTITFNTQILDTNFHYIFNLEKRQVGRKKEPVRIGEYNWIGNHAVIMKGVVTGKRCIIASGTLLNKKYVNEKGENSYLLLAGQPARIIQTMKQPIFSVLKESIINQYFKDNPEKQFYEVNDCLGEFDDESNNKMMFK